jgi:hypothetical protein
MYTGQELGVLRLASPSATPSNASARCRRRHKVPEPAQLRRRLLCRRDRSSWARVLEGTAAAVAAAARLAAGETGDGDGGGGARGGGDEEDDGQRSHERVQ